jgi:hypothetical protein
LIEQNAAALLPLIQIGFVQIPHPGTLIHRQKEIMHLSLLVG